MKVSSTTSDKLKFQHPPPNHNVKWHKYTQPNCNFNETNVPNPIVTLTYPWYGTYVSSVKVTKLQGAEK